jgi:hypothetical protein
LSFLVFLVLQKFAKLRGNRSRKIRKTGGNRRRFEFAAVLASLRKVRNSLKDLVLSVRCHAAADLHKVEGIQFRSQ